MAPECPVYPAGVEWGYIGAGARVQWREVLRVEADLGVKMGLLFQGSGAAGREILTPRGAD